jgi:ACS family hexuronate transporter-like MFS transporter
MVSRKRKSNSAGIFGAGASLGSVVALPLIAWSFQITGWQMTFLFIGFLGLLWILPWLFINKNTPEKHPWITKEEQQHILDDENKKTTITELTVYSWKQLLNFRNTWAIISSRFFIDPIWWMFVVWLPTFLKEQFAFDIKK